MAIWRYTYSISTEVKSGSITESHSGLGHQVGILGSVKNLLMYFCPLRLSSDSGKHGVHMQGIAKVFLTESLALPMTEPSEL